MEQLCLFSKENIKTIRRDVLKSFKKIAGETDDEYNELVRLEVDYRMSKIICHHPKYTDFDITTIRQLKSLKHTFKQKWESGLISPKDVI